MGKHIVIATAVFSPEPVVSARLMMDLACELSSAYKVSVIRPLPTRPYGFDQPELKKTERFDVITIEDSFTSPRSSLIGRYRESVSFGRKVSDYINKNKDNIDVVYNAVWPLFGNKLVAKTCVDLGIPYVLSVQDIYPESILSKLPKWTIIEKIVNGMLLGLDRFTHENAYAIHTISEKMADYLAESRGVDRLKYRVVRNWQNAEEFIEFSRRHRAVEDLPHPFTFMYMGNVGPLAGLETVIDAFNTIDGDSRLVIAGSGSAKEMLRRKAGNNTKIEFWDVPAGQVPAVQAQADIMVLPIKKGFASSSIPSKLPAYMFSSKPVLCAVDENSDTAACIMEANGGWIVEAEDSESLALQMKKCLTLPYDSLVKMGERNFNYAVDNFDRHKGVKRLTSIFKEILDK